MIAEQRESDRRRFLERFGIDIENFDENPGQENVAPNTKGKIVEKRTSRHERAFKPYNGQIRG